MGNWYVRRMDSQDNISILKRIFLIPEIKQVQNYYIVIVPIKKNKELNEKTQERLGKAISKRIYENQNQNVILANSLKLHKLENVLLANNLKILDGTWLFTFLVPHIITYIANVKELDSHELEVSILVNNNSENVIKVLIDVAKEIKLLNIVTDDIDKFKAMEDYLFTNHGIVIRTTNNKKKGLLKSNLIINFDFSEEEINKFAMPKDGIVVNTKGKITIKSRKFNGINCNSYNIILPKEKEKWFKENYLLDDFSENELYESLVCTKKTYDAIKNEIKESKIKDMIGNNGKIREEEYKNL